MVSLARTRSGAIVGRLNKFQSTAENILDRVTGVGVAVAAVLVVAWPFVFTCSIAAREFFHTSTGFVEEYTGYWTLFITCLALAYTLRKGGHIKVTVVVEHLSQKVGGKLEVFVALVALATSCYFTVYSAKMVIFAYIRNIHCIYGTYTLLWPIYLWVPIGFGLLSLALLLYFSRSILRVSGKD